MMTFKIEEPTASVRDAPAIATSYEDPHIATAGKQTFGRLRAMIARGYVPDFEGSDDDCLVLVHPQKRFRYRHMLLDSTGTVWWRYDQDYTTHFSRWEKKRFEMFLRAVPAPGWWDRTQVYRERICAFVIGAVLCAILYVAALHALWWAYRLIGWV